MNDVRLSPDEQLRENVFQALGAASTCWERMEGTGVFDSTRAKQIGDGLLVSIQEWADAKFGPQEREPQTLVEILGGYFSDEDEGIMPGTPDMVNEDRNCMGCGAVDVGSHHCQD